MSANETAFVPLLPSRHTEMALSAVDEFPLLSQMHTHWQGASESALPNKIEPFDIPPRLMPYIMLLELEDSGPRLRVRLAGTEVCAKHGGELKGKTTDDFFLPDDASTVVEAALQSAKTRQPTLARREYIGLDDRIWGYVRLILPLSSDGVRVDRFFKAVEPSTLREFRPG